MVGRELALLQKNLYLKLAYRCYGTLNVGSQLKHIYLRRAVAALHLPANAKILDAGCGTGLESFWLARRFPEGKVVGVELFPDQIDALNKMMDARPVPNFELIPGDLAEVVYQDEFDLVYCSAVLEHVENDEAVIERLAGCLKPGGTLLLDVPLLPQFSIFKFFKDINAPLNHAANVMGERVGDTLVTVPSREADGNGLSWGPTYAYSGLDHAREGYDHERLVSLLERNGLTIAKQFQAYGFWATLMWEFHEVMRWWNLRPLFFPLYFGFAYLETFFKVKRGNKIHLILNKASDQ